MSNLGYNILADIMAMPEYRYADGKAHFEPVPDALKLSGVGNTGSRQDFADKIAAMDDEVFIKITEERIWLSAYAANNLRSDYHWQADACYHEAQRRGNPELYSQAWHKASGM